MRLHALPPTSAPDVAALPQAGGTHVVPYTHGVIDQTSRSHFRASAFVRFLTVLFGAADAVLIKTVFNQLLLDSAWISWSLALGIAGLAAFLAWTAGEHAIIWRVHRLPDHAWAAGLLGLSWAFLGAAVTYLRWTAGDLQVGVATEGVTAADTGESARHHAIALALLAFYVAPGFLAAAHAYTHGNPIARLQRQAFEKLNVIRPRLIAAEAAAVEMAHVLRRHERERLGIEEGEAVAETAARALNLELKARARTEVARHLARPSAVPGPETSARDQSPAADGPVLSRSAA